MSSAPQVICADAASQALTWMLAYLWNTEVLREIVIANGQIVFQEYDPVQVDWIRLRRRYRDACKKLKR